MITVTEVRDIRKLKTVWEEMIDPEMGKVYLTYEFHLSVYRSFHTFNLWTLVSGTKLIYFCAKDGARIVSILPLVVYRNVKLLNFAGDQAAAGYNDIIGESEEGTKAILDYLKTKYKGFRLELEDIRKDSILVPMYSLEPHRSCYSIPITDGYDSWLKSLEHRRRNTIRHGYRNLDIFPLEFHLVSQLNKAQLNEVCRLYYKHLWEISTSKTKTTQLLYRYKSKSYRRTPILAALNSMARCKIAYSTHAGKIVAFHLFFEEANGVIIPKTAYDTVYSEYSPGTFNLNELLKEIASREMPIEFDLSRGYHPYKVWFGGQEYKNYVYDTTLE